MSNEGLPWSAPPHPCNLTGGEGGREGWGWGLQMGLPGMAISVSCVPLGGHDTSLRGCYLHFFFLRLHPSHMEVPRLGVEWELQLRVYARATAMWDPSRVCNLHHSSQQCQILNPPSKARDGTCILLEAMLGF